MKSHEFINETTTAGGIATVASGLGAPFTRNASIYGAPKKKIKKYKNSINEARKTNNFLVIYKEILEKKYPDVEFMITGDKLHDADFELTIIAHSKGTKKYYGVFMWDVDSGPYKGGMVLALKETFKRLKKLKPGRKPAIWLDDDYGAGVWQHLAQKLKFTIIKPVEN